RGVSNRFQPGDIIAEERWHLPVNWHTKSLRQRWDALPEMLGGDRFLTHLQIWFERQMLRLRPGFVHLPANLCSLAAAGNAIDSELYWDVTPSLSYYRDDCEAFVLPTVQINHWDAFVGVLPGDIYYD